jgi:triosephosphate isomerase
MRKPVIAGNWKMYKTPTETTLFFEKFRPLVEQSQHCEIVICPPFNEHSRSCCRHTWRADSHWCAEYRLG